jgi:hypothetical protein
VREASGWYHLRCVPGPLLDAACEEYRAILRKGVRYFVEKYAAGPLDGPELGARFLDLGRALKNEQERRAQRSVAPRTGSPGGSSPPRSSTGRP